ncbi:hypothetical protein L218DRAFT_844842, partial [Marasmius fiardii PR-910]
SLNTETSDLLDSLHSRETECAGEHSLLRVIASWPAQAELQRLLSTQRPLSGDPDQCDGHPIATLNPQKLTKLTHRLSPTDILQ